MPRARSRDVRQRTSEVEGSLRQEHGTRLFRGPFCLVLPQSLQLHCRQFKTDEILKCRNLSVMGRTIAAVAVSDIGLLMALPEARTKHQLCSNERRAIERIGSSMT